MRKSDNNPTKSVESARVVRFQVLCKTASAPAFQAFQQAAQGEANDLRVLQAGERDQLLQYRNVGVTQSESGNLHAQTVTPSRRKISDSAVNRYTNICRTVPYILAALRFCLSCILLPPSICLGGQPKSIAVDGATQMHILASLCGQRSEQFSPKVSRPDRTASAFSSSNVRIDLSPPSVQTRSNDLGKGSEPGVVSELFNNLHVGSVQAKSCNPSDPFHRESIVAQAQRDLDHGQSLGHVVENRHTNDIHGNSENPDSGTQTPKYGIFGKPAVSSKHSRATVGSTPHPPLDWLLSPKKSKPRKADRLIADLIRQEAHERDPHRRADLRIAQVTILKAMAGETDAFDKACLSVLHCRAKDIWPNIVANRRKKLGAEYYEWYFADDTARPDIPNLSRKEVHADFATLAHPMEPTGADASVAKQSPKPAPVFEIQRKDKRA